MKNVTLTVLYCIAFVFFSNQSEAIQAQVYSAEQSDGQRMSPTSLIISHNFEKITLEEHLGFFEQKNDVIRFAGIELNDAVRSPGILEEGSILVINLFDEVHYLADLSRTYVDINGTLSLIARGTEPSMYVIITTSGDRSLGSIYLPSKSRYYKIISDSGTLQHYLIEMDAADRDIVPGSPPLITPDNDANSQEQERIRNHIEQKGLGPGDPANIDVMIVYTPEAENWANINGGGIGNVLAHSMTNAQLVNDNSVNLITMTLVHSAPVSYTAAGCISLQAFT